MHHVYHISVQRLKFTQIMPRAPVEEVEEWRRHDEQLHVNTQVPRQAHALQYNLYMYM